MKLMGLIKENHNRQNRKRFGVRSSNYMLEEQFRSRCRDRLRRMETVSNTREHSTKLPERVILEPIKRKDVQEQILSPRSQAPVSTQNLNQEIAFPEGLNKQIEQLFPKLQVIESCPRNRRTQSHNLQKDSRRHKDIYFEDLPFVYSSQQTLDSTRDKSPCQVSKSVLHEQDHVQYIKRFVTNATVSPVETNQREQSLIEINAMIRQNAKVKVLSPIPQRAKMVRKTNEKPVMVSRNTSSYSEIREIGIDKYFTRCLREESPENQEDAQFKEGTKKDGKQRKVSTPIAGWAVRTVD